MHTVNIYFPNSDANFKNMTSTRTQMTGRLLAKKALISHSFLVVKPLNVILHLLSPRDEVSFPTLISAGLVTCFGKEDVIGSNTMPIPNLSLKRLYMLPSSLWGPCHHYENKLRIACYRVRDLMAQSGQQSQLRHQRYKINRDTSPTVDTRRGPAETTLHRQLTNRKLNKWLLKAPMF